MSIFTLQPKDDPNAPTFNVEREHVSEFRRVLRELFAKDGSDPKTLNRNNSFFIETTEAVKALDNAGFDYGAELNQSERYWFVVFCSRALRHLRSNPKHAPKYVEVF
jgi:hypothetical protein